MNDNPLLIFVYRDQIAKIREIMIRFETIRNNQSGFGGDDYDVFDELKAAVNDTRVDDTESIHQFHPGRLIGTKEDGSTYVIEIGESKDGD